MNPNPGPTPIPCHLLGFIGVSIAVRVVRAVEGRLPQRAPVSSTADSKQSSSLSFGGRLDGSGLGHEAGGLPTAQVRPSHKRPSVNDGDAVFLVRAHLLRRVTHREHPQFR